MLRILIVCSVLTGATSATANPLERLQLVGQSSMHWMFWKLYDVALYSADGRYQQGIRPLALSITYAREIESEKLIEATLGQWNRLSIEFSPGWVDRLRAIWPSVKPGDRLTFTTDQLHNNRFYLNGDLVGEFSDAQFAAAFLAIWLSVDTQEPEMRKALIGAANA